MDSGVGERTTRFAFVLAPRFSMMALVGAVEVLRLANRLGQGEAYSWVLISADGETVIASNGMPTAVQGGVQDLRGVEYVFVVGGLEIQAFDDKRVAAALRRLISHGARIGALCTGTQVLARFGLLNGYKCTIHWENLPGFAQEFEEVETVYELFEIDRDRYTCAGGTAAIDMLLSIVARDQGQDLAVAISEQLLHERIRDAHDHQRMALQSRLGVSHPKLLAAIQKMEDNIEEPLSFWDIAREVGLSTRQLERLFRKYLGQTPTRFYLELRLNRARLLLTQTTMSVIGVALSCGFLSPSHFSKCYREFFGNTPREERLSTRVGAMPRRGADAAADEVVG